MTGSVGALLAKPQWQPITLTSITGGGITAQIDLQINTDGSIGLFATSTGGSSVIAGPDSWRLPLSGGYGLSYYARWNQPPGGGSLLNGTSPAGGVWTALNTGPVFQSVQPAIGARAGSVSIEVASDAAGANIVATFLLSFTCQRVS